MNNNLFFILLMITLLVLVFASNTKENNNINHNKTTSNLNPQHLSEPSERQPRQKAPFFSAIGVTPSRQFETFSLDQYKGKYLAIIFYPFDFTYVCPTEIIAFSDSIDKFKAINADVIAISTDSHFTHLAWIQTPRDQGGVGYIKIPLLADISKTISRSYGVLVEDQQDELFGAALRGLFIIDGNGIIRMIQINDAHVGRSVQETLRLIQAFQFTDKHGEVCPANWHPGSETIIPNQEEKMKYFNHQPQE